MSSTAAPAYPQSNGWLMPGIVLLALAILLLDYLTPEGYSVSSLYLIPLLLTARSREQRFPPIVAAFCTVLVIIGAFVDSRGDVVARAVIFRRSVAISVLWITALLLVQRMRAEEGWRRHSDDALRRAHDRLRRFVDANIAGVVVESSSGAIIEANDYYLRTIGYTREELEKGLVNWRALTPPEWLTADEHAMQELRERGICTPYEKEYVRRDGSRVSVFLSDAILPGPEKEIVAFVLDITERKRADEEKQATEERLRLFIEHAPASLAMFDREMRYLSVSRRWMNDYGLGERDLRGLSHYEIFPEIDDRWKAIHKRALAGEVVRDDADRLDRLDGSVQWLRWEVRPWHDAAGKVGGIVVFSEDITERRRAEELQKETESKFRLLFTSMSEGAVIADIICDEAGNACDFRRVEANPAYLQQTGLSAESVVRQTGLEAYPLLEPYWIERFGQVVLTGKAIRFEDYHRATDRHFELAAFAMGGKRFGVVFTDVTPRKRSEERIARITERLTLATRAAHLGIWDWDIVHDQLVWDDRMYELYGVRKEDFGGAYEAWINGLHPDDRAESEETFRQLLSSGGSEYQSEFRVVWPDGSVRHLIAHGTVIRDESGKPLRLIGVNNDITERKQAEEALRQSEDQWRSAFRAAPIPFGLSSLDDGRFVDVNDAYTRLFGYSREEIIGHTSADFGLYESFSSRATMFQRLQRDGKIADFETTMRAKSGKLRSVVISSTVISLQGKSHILGTVIDITERKRAEAEIRRLHEDLQRHAEELDQRVRERTVQLEAANKELESFSYSVSHDLRAPLRAINGFARILTEDQGDKLDAEGRRVLRVVCGEASRMGHLIDDLLQFSRLGRQPLRKSVTDMTALVRAIYEELRAQTPERTVDFVLDSLPDVPADPALLRQVWFNLLDNAWKFTRHREHARIVLSGSIQAGEAIYSVADNGAGFDMRYGGKLFAVFQRLHALDEFEGTGVGLALVQQVVRRHGGRVWAEGAVDRGATFSFSLPLSEMPMERRKESE
jgi:PAS domain S-box-containing protein